MNIFIRVHTFCTLSSRVVPLKKYQGWGVGWGEGDAVHITSAKREVRGPGPRPASGPWKLYLHLMLSEPYFEAF